jgi:hypothetical protein
MLVLCFVLLSDDLVALTPAVPSLIDLLDFRLFHLLNHDMKNYKYTDKDSMHFNTALINPIVITFNSGLQTYSKWLALL